MSLLWKAIEAALINEKPLELSSCSSFEKEYYASQVKKIGKLFETNEKESDQLSALTDLLFKYFDEQPTPTSTFLVAQDIRAIVLQELTIFILDRNDVVETKWFNEKLKDFQKAKDQYDFTMRRAHFVD